jgi:hypothetical protein
MLVHHKDERNNNKTIQCDQLTEGDHGIHLIDRTGSQVGYVPYESLEYVKPEDSE